MSQQGFRVQGSRFGVRFDGSGFGSMVQGSRFLPPRAVVRGSANPEPRTLEPNPEPQNRTWHPAPGSRNPGRALYSEGGVLRVREVRGRAAALRARGAAGSFFAALG